MGVSMEDMGKRVNRKIKGWSIYIRKPYFTKAWVIFVFFLVQFPTFFYYSVALEDDTSLISTSE